MNPQAAGSSPARRAMPNKLFIIVRADLPPGAQLAQSVHACTSFAHAFPTIEGRWYAQSNNLVCLQTKDEASLMSLAERSEALGIAHSVFREPDFNNEATAMALAPEGWRLVSSLPLALRTQVKESSCQLSVQ